MQRPSRLTFLTRFSRHCNHWIEQSLLALGLMMSGVVILQVFCRYGLNYSLFWSEELARYLLVWLTFLGATVAYHRNIHPSIDVLYRRLPCRLQRVCNLFTLSLSLLFFMVMIWYGTRFAYFVRYQTTPALALPKWLLFAVIPVSGGIFSLHAIAAFFSVWNNRGGAT